MDWPDNMCPEAKPAKPEGFEKSAAEVVLAGQPLSHLENRYGLTPETVLALMDGSEAEINRHAVELAAEGRDIQLIAQGMMPSALRKLATQVEEGDLSPGTLLRVVETLNKVSGLEARARHDKPADTGRFVFTINFAGSKQVVFDSGNVVDGEAREVSGDA